MSPAGTRVVNSSVLAFGWCTAATQLTRWRRTPRTGPMPMRVLIVDDHPIVASGCRAVLAGEPEIVLLEASDAESGERVFATEHPDISVIDINLPTVSGFELARRILARTPSARIIMFSMNDDPVFAARAIDIGAKGYVSKHRLRRTFVRAEPAVQADLARDGDPAAARRGEKSLRDCVAGPILLQDGRQHLLHHASEARRSLLRRTGSIGDRERRRVKRPVPSLSLPRRILRCRILRCRILGS